MLAQPRPVRGGIGHLDRLAAVEGHRPVAAEHDPGGARLSQRPGQDLEQPPHRPDPDPAAHVPQRLRRRARQPERAHPGSEPAPYPQVAGLREQAHREQEVQPDPGRQQPDPPLGRTGDLIEHGVGQLERDDAGQLAQVTGSESTRGDRDHRGNRHDGRTDGRLDGQRRSPVNGGVLVDTRPTATSVAMSAATGKPAEPLDYTRQPLTTRH